MAATYRTPGVYINEVSTIPASVAQVDSAVPAFVGYTEFATDVNGDTLVGVAKRISSMVEFEQLFGGPCDPMDNLTDQGKPKIELDDDNDYVISDIEIVMKYVMYQSMSMYFTNGGGSCYVVSVGGYVYNKVDNTIQTEISAGFDVVALEDEPTILLAPDAAIMTSTVDLGILQKHILAQCNKLQDRFAILDLIESASTDDVGEGTFRPEIGTQYLKYGAAYGPHLETTLSYNFQYKDLKIVAKTTDLEVDTTIYESDAAIDMFNASDDIAKIQALLGTDYLTDYDSLPETTPTTAELEAKIDVLKDFANTARGLVDLSLMSSLTNSDVIAKAVSLVENGSTLANTIKQAAKYAAGFPSGALTSFDAPDNFDGTELTTIPSNTIATQFNYSLSGSDNSIYDLGGTDAENVTLAIPVFRDLLVDVVSLFNELLTESELILPLIEEAFATSDPIYSSVQKAIAAKGMIVPPSGAIAGAYVATDSNRGVWKAPANISLSGVVKPTIKIDSATQEGLNVDPTTGKSINVIRSFTGKGVLIWGARTLAGNDNEWRYVPVRRLFNTIEESVKKATEFVVFEPNDGNTWVRTKTMIENYLTGLWRQGALAGAKPADAFFVNCGLGTTMTAQDILEGKMIVEIGLAAVRPAEFIILRFSHKLQES